MRHRKAGSKFNRNSSHRKAMFRNMVTSLLKYERIKTTDQKAKELRGWADHIITLAKRGDLHARRQALAIVREKAVVHKIFEEAPKRFASVSGGYTRVIKLGRRQGDAAMMSLIELVTPEVQKPKKKKAAKKKAAAKSAPKKAAAKGQPAKDTAAAADDEAKADAAEKTSAELEEPKAATGSAEDTAADTPAPGDENEGAQPKETDK
jgi:large subunit ribosomal protein L17